MKLGKIHWIGMTAGLILLLMDLLAFTGEGNRNVFMFILGLVFTVAALPFIIQIVLESKREQEINAMFLEFSRNLAESVTTGTPISKSIINMRTKNYGELTPHVQKLANQISVGIPVNQAFENFTYDVDNPVITRAVTLIREAEKAGGEIDYILESAAKSIAEVEKLKKERKATIYSLIVQGYIIFFIFIGIMMVMEFKILPLVTSVGSFGGFGTDVASLATANPNTAGSGVTAEQLSLPFLYLLLTQGFFAGLTMGKLTEGNIKSGIKHSFTLMIAAFLISTGSRLLLA
jgi:flagellar protein FlaJ